MRRFPFGRRRVSELDEEIRSHLDMAIRDRVARGESIESATFAARREFGNVGLVKETTRAMWGMALLDHLAQDLRYGARALRKNLGFTIVAVLTLGMSIGANTALFTLVNALLLRELPVSQPNEVVLASLQQSTGRRFTFSYPLFRDVRDAARPEADLAAAAGIDRRKLATQARSGDDADYVDAQAVTGNFFAVLGARAAYGRTLLPEDDDRDNPRAVAVLSHRFWSARFGADSSVIGREVRLGEVPLTVIGVMPEGFFGFQVGAHPDVWWPMAMLPQVENRRAAQIFDTGGNWWIRVIGRVPAQIDRSVLASRLAIVTQRHLEQFAAPRAEKWSEGERRDFLDRRFEFVSGAAGYTPLRKDLRQPFVLLAWGVLIVLLIACANVASLLLARGAARVRELSLRGALGAGRWRLLMQLLTESALLGGLAGGLGLIFAWQGTHLLAGLLRVHDDPIALHLTPDARVLAFTLGVSLLTSIGFGLAPALAGSRLDLSGALKSRAGSLGSSRQRLGQGLVVVQVALSLVLLMGVGLVVRTLDKLMSLDAGFTREGVVLFGVEFMRRSDVPQRAQMYRELVDALASTPGVRAASVSTFFLLSGGSWTNGVIRPGQIVRPGEDLSCYGLTVGPGFFATFGIPMIAGRDFDRRDEVRADSVRQPPQDGRPRRPWTSVVINQAMARKYFGEENAVGKYITFGRAPGELVEIIGVVKDTKYESLRDPAPPTFFVPFFQGPTGDDLTLAARTVGDPRRFTGAIPAIVRRVDPTLRVRGLRTMTDVVNGSLNKERVIAQLGGFFGVFALGLAALGLYGLLSFAVVQRTREIGVRVALGASRQSVLQLIIGRGLKLALLGTVLGVAMALAATRGLSSLLYGVKPSDPVALTASAAILLAIAALASWIPTRRAVRVDPMVALRVD
jgi:predicted permease